MAHDIRNGVRLPGTGRALHSDAVRALQLLDDGDLFMVVRQRKEQLARRALATATARQT